MGSLEQAGEHSGSEAYKDFLDKACTNGILKEHFSSYIVTQNHSIEGVRNVEGILITITHLE
jgi:hypothetical protein